MVAGLEIGASRDPRYGYERFLVTTEDDLYEFVRDAGEGVQLILDLGVHTPSQKVVLSGKRKMTIRGPRGAFVQPITGEPTAFEFEDSGALISDCIVLEGFTILGNPVAGDIIKGTGTLFNVFFRNLQIHGAHASANVFAIYDDAQGVEIDTCILRGQYEHGVYATPTGIEEVIGCGIVGCHFTPETGVGTGILMSGAGCKKNRIVNNWFEGLDVGTVIRALDIGVGEFFSIGLNQIKVAGAGARGMVVACFDSQILDNDIECPEIGIELVAADRNTIGECRIVSAGTGATGPINEDANCDKNLYMGNNLVSSANVPVFSGTNRTEIGTKQ